MKTIRFINNPLIWIALAIVVLGNRGDVNAQLAIVSHPRSQVVTLGQQATFFVSARGDGISYQWQLNGVDVPNATSRRLDLPALALSDLGVYRVVVGDSSGEIVSEPAELGFKQPQGRAVLFGQSASFNMETSGDSQFLFQWRHNGTNIVGANNPSLTVSNVGLSDLGLYTVVIKEGTNEVETKPALLKLARWTEVVYFGASEALPRDPNGPTFLQVLAEQLGVTFMNFAEGSADLAALRSQVNRYLAANKPNNHTLLGLWTGGIGVEWLRRPDVDTPGEFKELAHEFVQIISDLAEAGGRTFLVPTIYQTEFNPFIRTEVPHATNPLVQSLNRAVDEEIEGLHLVYDLTIFRPDMFQFFETIWAAPIEFGFSNLHEAAQNSPGNDDEFFWWDGLHTTVAAHRVISEEMFRSLAPSAIKLEPKIVNAETLLLRWAGGPSVPVLIQIRADLSNGIWEAFRGPTDTTEVELTIDKPKVFFRLLQLRQ